MSLTWPQKDKDETLDYHVDWSRYLDTNTISSVSWYVEDDGTKTAITAGETVSGITIVSASNTNSVASVFLTLGTDNKNYKFWCSITTDSGYTAERIIRLKIREYN